MNFSAIEQVNDVFLTKIGLTHQVDIQGILPRAVRIFFGYNKGILANCHGTALVTAGIFPVLTPKISPIHSEWVRENLSVVPLKDIQGGDLVLLGNDVHSFVFINHELCLSMNGVCCKPLELCLTFDVLKRYGFDPDALKREKSKAIKIYRKIRENDFEPMMPCILEYFRFYNNKNTDRLHIQLKGYVESVENNPDIQKTRKDAVKSLYTVFLKNLPKNAIYPYHKPQVIYTFASIAVVVLFVVWIVIEAT